MPGSGGCRKLLDILRKSRVAVFDLDGTLYDDTSYYRVADRAVAVFLARMASVPLSEAALVISQAQDRDGRSGYLDRICKVLGLPANVIGSLLQILRTVDAHLCTYSWVEALLCDLIAHDVRLYILTNGNREQQRNKIRSIGLDVANFPIEVVYASDHQPKPDPAGLRHILMVEGVKPQDATVIGNDRTDELCAIACGAVYIDVGRLNDCFSGGFEDILG